MKEKLTDTLAAKFVLPAGATDALIWDAAIPGFYLRYTWREELVPELSAAAHGASR